MILIELHRTQTPFAVVESVSPLTGKEYNVIFKDRYIRIKSLTRLEVRWFCDNKYLFKAVINNQFGKIYEYKQFRKKISHAMRHNFLVRNQIINGSYI